MFDRWRGGRGDIDRVEPRIKAQSPESEYTNLNDPDSWFTDWARGGNFGNFGPPINEQSAMRVSTVFACVKLMGDLVGGAPLGVYRDSDTRGRELAKGHRLYKLLHGNPFPGRPLTSFSWRQLWVTHVLLWGNHYSIIRYDNAARVVGFEPVLPWQVEVRRVPSGRNLYIVRYDREVPARTEVVDQDDMLHFAGPSFDGIAGVSRIAAFARDPIALARVLEEQTGRVHENASRPSGMLTLPAGIKEEGLRRLRANWEANQEGRQNAGKIVYAEAGQEYTPFQMTPEDLNTLAVRQYQSADICRFFGVPPHMIGEAAGTSAWGSGIEQLTLGYKQFTLHPQLCDFEQELRLKLFDGQEYYPAFDRDALVAMDAKTAAEVAQTEIQSGVLTINERRRQKQRPDVDGGDDPLVNATMITLERARTPPAPPAAPSPAEPKKGPPDAP